jgi:hypothetical protein
VSASDFTASGAPAFDYTSRTVDVNARDDDHSDGYLMTAPRTDWKEDILPGEAERFERLAVQLRDAPKRAPGDRLRALHAKGVAGVRAELTVGDNLPPEARVGIFAQPASYRAYVRFSNGAAVPQPDSKPDVRGLAMKVLGVPGTKLIPGLEAATTQDFLTIRDAYAPFVSPDEFVWVAVAAQSPLTFLPRALFHLGPARALHLIKELKTKLSVPYPSAAVSAFHSALAIRFGDHAVRFSFAPEAAAAPGAATGTTATYVHDDLRQRLLAGPIHYQFRVQFYVGEAQTPIENTAVEWNASDSPFVPIARLTIPQQDIDSEAGRRLAGYVESLSFDPWHAPVEFRPLGALMRARNAAYRVSGKRRGAQPEPTGTDWIA